MYCTDITIHSGRKKKHLKTTIIVLQVFGAVVSQALRIYLFT